LGKIIGPALPFGEPLQNLSHYPGSNSTGKTLAATGLGLNAPHIFKAKGSHVQIGIGEKKTIPRHHALDVSILPETKGQLDRASSLGLLRRFFTIVFYGIFPGVKKHLSHFSSRLPFNRIASLGKKARLSDNNQNFQYRKDLFIADFHQRDYNPNSHLHQTVKSIFCDFPL